MDEQGAVAEPEARLHELTPGVGPDEPVDVQVPFRLERAHGGVGEGPEGAAGLAGSQFVAKLDQPLLDVEDLGAFVTPAVDAHPVSVPFAPWTGNEPASG